MARDLASRIDYSEKYNDAEYEYRHVILPKELAKDIPKGRILAEDEWRALHIQQSRGWEHYAYHGPEPHILLFRRPLGCDGTSGKIDVKAAAAMRRKFYEEYGIESKD